MVRTVYILFVIILLGCKNENTAPDVSHIPMELEIKRFEQKFFNIDTLRIEEGLAAIRDAYPNFYQDYLMGILQVNIKDSQETKQVVAAFLKSYRPLYDTLQLMYKDMSSIEKKLEQNFRYTQYYFPDYKLPAVLTYIGTLDAPGAALTNQYVAIGLHQYAGRSFSAYQTVEGQQLYPSYISRRFSPEYIPVNCMKVISEDIFPDKSMGRPLIEQMIEHGKRLYLLDHLMPETPDSLLTGYTADQQEWVVENEGLIWNYIIENENLYSIDPVVIQTYIGEAPFTQNMPQASPGNIGQWIGWQIIKKYAARYPEKSIMDILNAVPRTILDDAKYKPK